MVKVWFAFPQKGMVIPTLVGFIMHILGIPNDGGIITLHMPCFDMAHEYLVLNRIQLKTLSLIDLKDMDVIVWMDYGSVPSTPPPSPEQLEMLFADVDLAIDQGTKMEREECIKEFRDSNSSLPSGIQTWHQYTKCPMHMSLRVSSMMVHLSLWTTG